MTEDRIVRMVVETRSYHLVELYCDGDQVPDIDDFPDWYELISSKTHIDSDGPIWHIPDQTKEQPHDVGHSDFEEIERTLVDGGWMYRYWDPYSGKQIVLPTMTDVLAKYLETNGWRER